MDEESVNECPICLQKLLYPAKLPCNHTFCFLCIKGIRRNPDAVKTCAMCRKPFNIEEIEQNVEIANTSIEKYKWFYESKNQGFWGFDERSCVELENAFNENKDHVIVSIAGFPYYIDFVNYIQYPIQHPERIRKIKRSNDVNFKVKGIAGVRLSGENSSSSDSKGSDEAGATNSNLIDNELSQVLSESLQIDVKNQVDESSN